MRVRAGLIRTESQAAGRIGLLIVFISAFLPWLENDSLFLGVQNETALSLSYFALVILLFLGGLIGGLLVLARQVRWSPAYPGILSALAGGFWLYELSRSGLLTSTASAAGILFGPYLAIIGGVCLVVSSRGWRLMDTQSGSYQSGYGGGSHWGGGGPRFRRPRIRWGPWVLFGLWLVATIIVGTLSLSPNSYFWYGVYTLGVIAGLWLGVRYFQWVEGSVHSTGRLFLATIGSFILAPIIGGITLGLYPASPCSLFPNLLASCQGTSYSLTFTDFYAPTYIAGVINSFESFTMPLALIVFLAALYGGYRLSRTIFVR